MLISRLYYEGVMLEPQVKILQVALLFRVTATWRAGDPNKHVIQYYVMREHRDINCSHYNDFS